MEFFEDYIIHLYVTGSITLSQSVRTEIGRLIEEDSGMKKRVDDVKLYYSEFEKIKFSDIEFNINRLISPNILPMKPYIVFKEENQHTTMAASTGLKDNIEFKYIQSYVSADNVIIARIIHNTIQNEYLIYLVSDNMEEIENAVVCLSGSDYYVSNGIGEIILKDVYITEDISLNIHRPVQRIILESVSENQIIYIPGLYNLSFYCINGIQKVRFKSLNINTNYKVFIYNSLENHIECEISTEGKSEHEIEIKKIRGKQLILIEVS